MEKYVEQSQLIDEIKNDKLATTYTSVKGKKCFRVVAPFEWYILKCKQYNLKIERKADFVCYTRGNGFDFDWIENDCILALDKK